MVAPHEIRPWVAWVRRAMLPCLALLVVLGGCAPPTADQDLRQEIKDLKAEVSSLKEQLQKLAAGQKEILAQLQKPAARLESAPAPGPQSPGPSILTVSQLLENQDRYLGTRVTVRGPVGPVLVHHKSLLLMDPRGMVEVFFDKLPDQKQMQRLTSTNIEEPVTVTGIVSLPPKGVGAKLQINAEAVEF
jgi:hypothetical protein